MIYADSSAIVKRYHEEPGTEVVRNRWTSDERIFTSRAAYAEVHAAFARKHREGELLGARFQAIAETFEAEWPAYDQIPLDNATLAGIPPLVRRHPLRAYDAIHLAAALWLRENLGDPVELWVSDFRLESAARREGITVVNPERSRSG